LADWSVWLQFLVIAGAITVAGSRLSKYGDVLAEKTGMGRTWLGLVLLAAVTSLGCASGGRGSSNGGTLKPEDLKTNTIKPGFREGKSAQL
jgi:hypothetical protein